MKKGFTLVELIIAMAMVAIVLACVYAFSQPVTAIVNDTNANARANDISTVLQNRINLELRNASYVVMYKNMSIEDATKILQGNQIQGLTVPELNERSRALVFKYVEHNDYDKSVYPFVINDLKAESLAGNITAGLLSTADSSSGKMNTVTGDYRLFDHGFYGGYAWTFDITPYVEEPDPDADPDPDVEVKPVHLFGSHIDTYNFRTVRGSKIIKEAADLYSVVYRGGNTNGERAMYGTSSVFRNMIVGEKVNKVMVYNYYTEGTGVDMHRVPVEKDLSKFAGAFDDYYIDVWSVADEDFDDDKFDASNAGNTYDGTVRPMPLPSSSNVPLIIIYEY